MTLYELQTMLDSRFAMWQISHTRGGQVVVYTKDEFDSTPVEIVHDSLVYAVKHAVDQRDAKGYSK